MGVSIQFPSLMTNTYTLAIGTGKLLLEFAQTRTMPLDDIHDVSFKVLYLRSSTLEECMKDDFLLLSIRYVHTHDGADHELQQPLSGHTCQTGT